jgi:hypothetical protein
MAGIDLADRLGEAEIPEPASRTAADDETQPGAARDQLAQRRVDIDRRPLVRVDDQDHAVARGEVAHRRCGETAAGRLGRVARGRLSVA